MRRSYKQALLKILNEIDEEKLSKACEECFGLWGHSKRTKARMREFLRVYLDKVKEELGL